ncbi:MAG: glycosyltransferase family 2 protein [Candidatus Binatia bacterium]|nr:glycosyltransferase family 2 protein [Candidatus Binatia bacterium]
MSGSPGATPTLSLVVPVLNEEETIPVFYRRAVAALEQTGVPFEIVFVDDGSQDNTFETARALSQRDPRVKIIRFSRNFGHQTAVTAGLHYAAGAAVAVIDGDLQDPPEFVPRLFEKWKEGYEVVYAVRRSRKENVFKRAAYRLFYRLLRRLSYIDIPLDSGDFAIMDRRVVDQLNAMPERNRFVRGIRAWVGFRQIGLEYDRDARFAGESKYSLSKLFRLAYDGLISYSYVPLRLATQFGFVISAVAFGLILYLLVLRIVYGERLVTGWTSTVVVILFLGGIQLLSLGILGEYVGRIFDEVKRRPLYVVRETVGFERSPHVVEVDAPVRKASHT